jgi:hypothetical protein
MNLNNLMIILNLTVCSTNPYCDFQEQKHRVGFSQERVLDGVGFCFGHFWDP